MATQVTKPVTRQSTKAKKLNDNPEESVLTINTTNFINELHEEWPKWSIEDKDQ